MATIRNLGQCLCPWCTTPFSSVHLVDMQSDQQARTSLACINGPECQFWVSTTWEAIYQDNYDINSAAVEHMLKPQSLVPSSVSIRIHRELLLLIAFVLQNAFSDRLSRFGLNFFLLFLIDLLHEVELGIWKALFVHLLHILEAADETMLYELDRRWASHLSYLSFGTWQDLAAFD